MNQLLQRYLTRQAQHRPEAAAVRLMEERMTYGALEKLSDQLASALHDAGCRRGDRVCILQEKSPRAVLSILGTLKADCIYVPVDVHNPPARLLSILAQTAPAAILCDVAGSKVLRQMATELRSTAAIIGWIDTADVAPEWAGAPITLRELERRSGPPPDSHNQPDDIAYILFTSGSTGVPKGVTITHANVAQFIEWAKTHFGLGPHDRLSGHSPLHFDLSTFDLFGSFAAGAELHLVPPEFNLLPPKLADFIRRTALTQWFSVPSILSYMAKWDVVREGDFPSLRRLLWCGEVFPTSSLAYWMRRLPHVTFTNLYGPTEATIASSHYTVNQIPESQDAEIPIGRPCPGEELHVLDDSLHRVDPGDVGELYIGGAGLSPGYWRNEERTAAAFISRPVSGERLYRTGDLARVGNGGLVYFVGREDSQVKSRGYRIELGEIEAALVSLDYLTECAVVAVDSTGFEGKLICCGYACHEPGAVAPARIRKDLQSRLPPYMIPARWQEFEPLPRNANGKIDRRELGERFGRSEVAAS
jgi:amino acid adenylation domain-containing protein